MKIGEETRVALEIIGTTVGLLAFVLPAALLADWLEDAVGIGASFAVIVGWPLLGLLAFALWSDNR